MTVQGEQPDNVAAIRDALDNAAPAAELAQAGDRGPETHGGRQPDQKGERPHFPPGCPVSALGIASTLEGSQLCYYLNYNGQLVGLEAGNKHGKNSLIALFGPASDWLEDNFPQYSKPVFEGRGKDRQMVRPPEIVGFDQAEASRALIEECARKGIFDPKDRMRGIGAHAQRGGGLVLHLGDKLYASRHYATTGELRDWLWLEPGMLDGHVYTAGSPTPRPWHEPVHASEASKLLMTIQSWNWKRALLDPLLILGGIGCSKLGGAMPWRSNLWLTGSAGTGKSSLNGEMGLLDQLFGEAQFRTANTSAAAVRSTLQNSTVPVFFDEIEASANNTQATQVIEAARVASSGGKVHRSGSDQKTREFTLRSPFWFSSINIPPLAPQDRSRLAICELRKLKPGTPPLDMAALHLPQLGRKMLRRMLDGWVRLSSTKAAYHTALAAGGHTARACDQFGTLLACADLLLHDDLPDAERVQYWADQCRPDMLAELADEVPDHVEAIHRLLTSEVQARGGDEREALSSWIMDAINYAIAQLLEDQTPAHGANAAKRLEQKGLKLVNPVYHPARFEDGRTIPARWGAQAIETGLPGYLAISGSHESLQKLFAGSRWQGGAWARTLGRYDGALERVKVSFARMKQVAVLVPLHQVLDEAELPMASRKAAAEKWVAEQVDGTGG